MNEIQEPTQEDVSREILGESTKYAYRAVFNLKKEADKEKMNYTRKIIAEENTIKNCYLGILAIKQSITSINGIEFSDTQKMALVDVFGADALEKIEIDKNIENIAKKREQIQICKRRLEQIVKLQKTQKKKIAMFIKAYNSIK